jgi:hypothetical protein
MKNKRSRRVSVPSDPLLAAAVFHSDKAEWWLRQERENAHQSAKFQDNCRKWYALHRMWQKAIERAANRALSEKDPN